MSDVGHIYPPPAEDPTCVLLFVPIELAPLVGGLLRRMERRSEWATDSDWQQGYKAFVELQDQLMSNCTSDIVAELRALRGINPLYEEVPIEERTTDMYRSFNDLLQAIMDQRGVLADGWFEDPVYATLADIVKAARGGDSNVGKGLWDDISQLISDASGLAGIANFITNLLNTAEETVVEGGLLTALVALTAANAALQQQALLDNAANAAKVNEILIALRGPVTQDDNVLLALRGNIDADENRNIVDLLE
jgi:cytochrome c-type biogenesis protein CcmH/NrfF